MTGGPRQYLFEDVPLCGPRDELRNTSEKKIRMHSKLGEADKVDLTQRAYELALEKLNAALDAPLPSPLSSPLPSSLAASRAPSAAAAAESSTEKPAEPRDAQPTPGGADSSDLEEGDSSLDRPSAEADETCED